MQPRLESRIATLRGQVRRLLALHGMSWVVGLLVPIVIVLGLADWLIHLDPAVRMLELVGLGVFGAWVVFRYVLGPLFVRFADLDIALRIEERWPGLNDRLASTIQFLKLGGDEDRFGSQAMRDATIRQTLDETKSVDFREVLERKPLHQALGLASAVVVAAVVIVAAAPGLSEIALRRLFLPFGLDQWPQQTHLSLLDRETPRKVARGEPFTLAVAVGEGERVPNSAKATYRFADGETATESLRAVEGGIFRGRIEAVDRPFRFSVTAGDDSTSIRDIEVKVVPPPALTELTVRLIAPAYTGKAPETLAPGLTQVRALEGTVVELSALANKPIERAALHLGEASAKEGVTFDSTRRRLTTKFTVAESVPFFFELYDTEGFRNREATRYEIRSSRDEAPRVVIDEPANDRDVPANATVPVRFSVDDDYGIHSARLIYKVASGGSEPTKDEALVLWEAKGNAQAGPVKHQDVTHDWNLAPMKLSPGSIITFHADARDFDDLKGPNLGKSREIRLRIVSDEDIAHELDDQRREIREETARIKAMQDQAMLPVDDASRTLARTDKLPQNERENLKNAEMIQRQVSSRINSRTDGLDHKIRRFLEDLKNFKVSNPDAQKQMEQMQAGVEQIRQKHLEPAEQGLTHASKNLDGVEPPKPEGAQPDAAEPGSKPEAGSKPEGATDQAKSGQASAKGSPKEQSKTSASSKGGEPSQPKGGDPKAGKADPQDTKNEPRKGPLDAAKEGLAEAKANQKAISDELQKMLDSLSEFETYRGVVKDAQNLLKEQEQAMKQAAEAAAKEDLMGKTPDALTPEQKADLANLSARQQNVARGLQGLQERMDEMAKRLDESDPLAGSAMRGAAEESRKKQTGAKMGEAADQLEKNQMGEARNSQEQARQDLKELVDSIQNRRERELARLVKELKNAEKDLQKLRDRQAQNLKKTRDAQNNPDAKKRADELQKLAKEQAEIQKELDKQLKRLAKLNAESAARAGAKAASKMGKAQRDLDQDQGEQAGKEEEDALADLDDAQDQVKQARKEAEEQLAMEQLAKMGDQLKSISERQDNVVTRTTEYEKLRAENEGKLTFPQQRGVRNLGDVQAGIKDETGQLAEKLDGAPVFALTLKRAGEGMETAAQRLQALKTDDETKRAAASASRRFKQLIDALKADPGKEGGQKPPGGGNEGGGAGGGGGGDGIPPAAQVKMLKALQEEINDRTEFFDEQKRRGKTLTPEQDAEIERLQTDQGTLADLVRDLTKPKKADGEE